MVTRHTGIPMMRFRGAYPPCSPAVYIAADVNPFCAGETVTFTPTLVCLDDAVSYSWIVESVEVSTSSDPYSTNTLVGGNRVILKVVNSLGQSIYSNMIIVQEKTEGCITEIKYGLLYNWYAATDARGFTSAGGFVVPSYANWITLANNIGGIGVAGGKLKEMGFTYFASPNTGATNEVGFYGRGSGSRTTIYNGQGLKCFFLTTQNYTSIQTYIESLSNTNDDLAVGVVNKNSGAAIRLVRPATEPEKLLADGTACANYTGNDGKVYRTVKIGTQVWLADNLAETKFRNGDYIHGFDGGVYTPISNEDWAALTTDGVCVYDDDLNNM